jgi:hypothetical protein
MTRGILPRNRFPVGSDLSTTSPKGPKNTRERLDYLRAVIKTGDKEERKRYEKLQYDIGGWHHLRVRILKEISEIENP